MQVIRIGRVVDMLELAAAAFGEVAAGRILPVRAGHHRGALDPVARRGHRHEPAALGHSVAARGEGDDGFPLAHRQLMRSSAIIFGPARRAASAWRHTPAQAASNGSFPAARSAAMMPARTSPEPAVPSQGGAVPWMAARPSGAATTVSGPL